MLIPFKWPLRGMIADPSQSGKSTLVAELIKHKDESIQPPPERILFFKKYPSSVPPSIQHLVEYRENLPTEDDLLNQSKQRTLIILADLQDESFNSPQVAQAYQTGRHQDISILTLTQNLFPR